MSSTRRDTPAFSWLTVEGRTRIRGIVEELIPQWSNGGRPHQIDSWAHTLEKVPVLLISSTGSGKTAAFYIPILIMRYLLQNPVDGIPKPPKHPVALVVTPLVELGNSQAREMGEIGMRAVALNAESISKAFDEGRNLYREIAACHWSIVLLSAERLTSKEFDAVIRNETFQENVAVLGIDEAHVLVPWSLEFRTAYQQILLLHRRLPDHVALVVATATLAPGPAYDALCSALDLRPGAFHCIRLSCERPNVRTVIQELGHSLSGYTFPGICWVFVPGMKAVVYCRTLELSWRVAVYGWSMFPPGETRLLHVRLWNSITSATYNQRTLDRFRQEDTTSIIIASIAFGMGMNLVNIRYSINLGIPEGCDALVQQNGRAGRDLVSDSFGITYVEPTVYSTVKGSVEPAEEIEAEKVALEEEGDGIQSDSEVPSKTSKKKVATKPRTKPRIKKAKKAAELSVIYGVNGGRSIEKNLARLLGASVLGQCIEAEKNAIYGNPGNSVALRCKEAGRPLPCTSCEPFSPPMTPGPTPPPSPPPPPPPPPCDATPTNPKPYGPPLPPPLNQTHRAHAKDKLMQFARQQWSAKRGARFLYIPYTAYWPSSVLSTLLDRFHLFRSRELLHGALADWEFLAEDGINLFLLIDSLNQRYDGRVCKAKFLKQKKAATTRERNSSMCSSIVVVSSS
ncbi:ATP-dependent DNA helicase RecQ [Lyophyllum atratum]|nr:ATP-dependent DNA helicase RecQ [Lyophyllum atratum]